MQKSFTTLQKFVNANDISPSELPVISSRSEKVIEWLYDKIANADVKLKNISNSSFNISMHDYIIRNVYTDLGESYRAINQNIRSKIDNLLKKKRVYTFSVGGRNVILTIVFPENRHIAVLETEFADILHKVYIWFCVAGELSNPSCSSHIRIFIIMSELKKILPENNLTVKILSETNVNTAQTMSCRPSNEIHIYRKEEWFKVFIHETMHALGIDFSEASYTYMNMVNVRLKKTFPLTKSDLRIYETYCEFWAEIFNIIFHVYLSRPISDKFDFKPTMSEIKRCIRAEQTWSIFQCAKIMSFYDINYTDLYSDKSHIISLVNSRYNENNTSTFSYYVAKTIILYNVGEFLEWCVSNNRNVVAFRITNATALAFCDFITSRCRDPNMIKHIQRFQKIIKNTTHSSNVMRTMRMSLYP